MNIIDQIKKQNRTGQVARIAFFLILILQIASPSAPVKAANATIYHEFVPAGAELSGNNCPQVTPQTDTQCEDFYVLYWLGGLQQSDVHWGLFVRHAVAIFHPDGTVTDLSESDGFLENPHGTFDMNKYTYAQVNGSVPMSDGSAINVDLTWDMGLAELHHGGNNSAYNLNNGITRHYASPCLTLNQIDHQQWRAGAPGMVTGTIGGIVAQSLTMYPDEPFIEGRNHWTYVSVTHGGCIVG
jgi:hypothetical protein